MGVIQARDLSKHGIHSASEGLDLLKKAMANRMVSEIYFLIENFVGEFLTSISVGVYF